MRRLLTGGSSSDAREIAKRSSAREARKNGAIALAAPGADRRRAYIVSTLRAMTMR
jgi:hypothetical protein